MKSILVWGCVLFLRGLCAPLVGDDNGSGSGDGNGSGLGLGLVDEHPTTRRFLSTSSENVFLNDMVEFEDTPSPSNELERIMGILDSIERDVDPILFELASPRLTYRRAKILIPQISVSLRTLRHSLRTLSSPSSPNSLSPSEHHRLSIRMTTLLGSILLAISDSISTLRIDIAVLRPLIKEVSEGVQDVVDTSVGVWEGVGRQLVGGFSCYEKILEGLGVRLVVDGIRV